MQVQNSVSADSNKISNLKTNEMMKRIIHFILAMFIAIPIFGQTVELEKVIDAPPGTVDVDIYISDFTGVGAITLYIEYDSNLLTYTGPLAIPFEGASVIVNPNYLDNPDMMGVSWQNFSAPGASFGTDELFISLEFDYTGGFETELNFVHELELATYLGNILHVNEYIDGSISPKTDDFDGSASLSQLDASAGTPVEMVLTIADLGGFEGSASVFEFFLAYSGNLEYVNVKDNNLGLTVSHNQGDGTLKLTREVSAAITGFPLDAVTLQFTYLGGGPASVDFLPGSFVADNFSDYLLTAFYNGGVDPILTGNEPVIEIEKVTTVGAVSYTFGGAVGIEPQPESVEVTLSEEIANLGAIALNIEYDTGKLDFQTLIPNGVLPAGWTFSHNASQGLIQVTRNPSTTGYTLPEGLLFTLNFEYLLVPEPGLIGQADISFVGGSLLQDPTPNVIDVGFVDGWISMILPGDVNCSGTVGLTDILLLINHLYEPFDPLDCPQNADIDGNGLVNLQDLLLLINMVYPTTP